MLGAAQEMDGYLAFRALLYLTEAKQSDAQPAVGLNRVAG
jgi:hypothetical protein